MVKLLVTTLLSLYFVVALSYGITYVPLGSNEWTAINQNKCN